MGGFIQNYCQDGDVAGIVIDYIGKNHPQNADEILVNAQQQGTFQTVTGISDMEKDVLRTAIEISPRAHLEMVGALAGINGVVDESASKTVNLNSSSSPGDVLDTFITAYDLGLKAIAVYVDKSKKGQPVAL